MKEHKLIFCPREVEIIETVGSKTGLTLDTADVPLRHFYFWMTRSRIVYRNNHAVGFPGICKEIAGGLTLEKTMKALLLVDNYTFIDGNAILQLPDED